MAGLDMMSVENQFILDLFNAYVDYPDEDMLDFANRAEALMLDFDTDTLGAAFDDYKATSDECLGY